MHTRFYVIIYALAKQHSTAEAVGQSLQARADRYAAGTKYWEGQDPHALHAPRRAAAAAPCAVTSLKLNSQKFKVRDSNSRVTAYFDLKMQFNGSKSPGAGPRCSDRSPGS